jgi:hypothetical protein
MLMVENCTSRHMEELVFQSAIKSNTLEFRNHINFPINIHVIINVDSTPTSREKGKTSLCLLLMLINF